MPTEPQSAITLPFFAQTLRHRIKQTKRDKINCPLLLPMRQAIGRLTNLRERIKELKLRIHTSRSGGFPAADLPKNGGRETAAPCYKPISSRTYFTGGLPKDKTVSLYCRKLN